MATSGNSSGSVNSDPDDWEQLSPIGLMEENDLHAHAPGLHKTPCGWEKQTVTHQVRGMATANAQTKLVVVRVRWVRICDCNHGYHYGSTRISVNVWMGNHPRTHFSFHILPMGDQARRYDRYFELFAVRYVLPTGTQCAVNGHTDNKCVYNVCRVTHSPTLG